MIFQSLKDHVYEYISNEIKNKKLKPNEKINEQAICDQLNVSRTPVREALIQLSSEDLLEITPRKGFRVKSLTLKEAKDLYAVIGSLDALAATIALPKMNADDLNKMRTLIANMDLSIESYTFSNYFKLQMEFHNVYIFKTENQPLIDTMTRLKKRFIRQSYPTEKSDMVKSILLNTNKEHKKILQLFEEKNMQELSVYLKDTHWNLNYAEMDSLDE